MKTLTPRDTPIFDEFVIADLEKHWGEPLLCGEGDGIATSRMMCKQCNIVELICMRHTQFVMSALARNDDARCNACGATGRARDIASVVSL